MTKPLLLLSFSGAALGVAISSGGVTTQGLTDVKLGESEVNVSAGNANLTTSLAQTTATEYDLTLTGPIPYYSGDSLTGTDSNDWAVKVDLVNVVDSTSKVVSVTAIAGTAGSSPAAESVLTNGTLYIYGNHASIDSENTVTVVIDRDGVTGEGNTADQISIVIGSSNITLASLSFGNTVSNDMTGVWGELTQNAGVSATIAGNVVTLSGTVPFYGGGGGGVGGPLAKLTGDNGNLSINNENCWGFYVELENYSPNVTLIEETALLIKVVNGRLYVAGTYGQVMTNPSFTITNNIPNHSNVALIINGINLNKEEGGGVVWP